VCHRFQHTTHTVPHIFTYTIFWHLLTHNFARPKTTFSISMAAKNLPRNPFPPPLRLAPQSNTWWNIFNLFSTSLDCKRIYIYMYMYIYTPLALGSTEQYIVDFPLPHLLRVGGYEKKKMLGSSEPIWWWTWCLFLFYFCWVLQTVCKKILFSSLTLGSSELFVGCLFLHFFLSLRIHCLL